jgi:alginate O-acetyltransferase complex protein AlgI
MTTVQPWVSMWAIAFALYACCKWLTYRDALSRGATAGPLWGVAYLVAWPGMDAVSFLSAPHVERPRAGEWTRAAAKFALGIALVWTAARLAAVHPSLLAGWIGMTGLVLVLHFGSFELLSLAWRRAGVDAIPVMQQPLRSASLSEFWGRRWNTAFHELAVRFTFRPLRAAIGVPAATALVFVLSGVIHELVISVPAHAGYGLPTTYFSLQAGGIIVERTRAGKALGLGAGVRGRIFTAAWAGAPAFILFPPVFVRTVVLPMLARIAALGGLS